MKGDTPTARLDPEVITVPADVQEALAETRGALQRRIIALGNLVSRIEADLHEGQSYDMCRRVRATIAQARATGIIP